MDIYIWDKVGDNGIIMRIKQTDINVDIKCGDLKGYEGIYEGYLCWINNWISMWIYLLDIKEYIGI